MVASVELENATDRENAREGLLCSTVPMGANLWAPDSIFPVE